MAQCWAEASFREGEEGLPSQANPLRLFAKTKTKKNGFMTTSDRDLEQVWEEENYRRLEQKGLETFWFPQTRQTY